MPAYVVHCYTCLIRIYEGDTPPDDGQVLLTAYADSTPGTACPSKVDRCPHKTAAINTAKQREPAALLARLVALEAKAKP